MGNGKGNPEYFVAEIRPGKVLYEMDGVDEPTAREAFALASAKLPCAQFRVPSDGVRVGEEDMIMKASELRAKDPAQLSKELEELLRAQFGLRMQKATQQLTNNSQLKACAVTSRGCAPS